MFNDGELITVTNESNDRLMARILWLPHAQLLVSMCAISYLQTWLAGPSLTTTVFSICNSVLENGEADLQQVSILSLARPSTRGPLCSCRSNSSSSSSSQRHFES